MINFGIGMVANIAWRMVEAKGCRWEKTRRAYYWRYRKNLMRMVGCEFGNELIKVMHDHLKEADRKAAHDSMPYAAAEWTPGQPREFRK